MTARRSTAAARLAGNAGLSKVRRMQCAFAGSRVLQATLWRARLQRLDALFDVTGSGAAGAAEKRRHLLASAEWPWLNWCAVAAQRGACAEVMPWFALSGADELARARSAGRGAILASGHYGSAMLLPTAFAWHGIEHHPIQGPGLGDAMPPERAALVHPLEIDPRAPGAVLDAARRALSAGGTVMIAPDGFFGEGGVEVEFCGRRRRFRAGFAALAADSGAPVLPLFAPVDEAGRSAITIHPPLAPGPGESRSEAIAALVAAYADALAGQWRRDLANVFASHVEQFLAMPRAH